MNVQHWHKKDDMAMMENLDPFSTLLLENTQDLAAFPVQNRQVFSNLAEK